MFRVPEKLSKYIDFDSGKLVISKDLPKSLENDVKELEKSYKAIHKSNDLTEY
jgi:hypothetical protein